MLLQQDDGLIRISLEEYDLGQQPVESVGLCEPGSHSDIIQILLSLICVWQSSHRFSRVEQVRGIVH